MKKILPCIISASIMLSMVQPLAYADIETKEAQYNFDAPVAVNAVDETKYAINPSLVKDHEYDTNYYVPTKNGIGATTDLGEEPAKIFKDSYTVEMWFRQDSSCTNIERRIMTVADQKTIYVMTGLNGSRLYVTVTYQYEDNGTVKTTMANYIGDKSVKSGWNHLSFSVDKSNEGKAKVYGVLNGSRIDFSSAPVTLNMSTVVDLNGKTIAPIPDDSRFYINGSNKRLSFTYGTGWNSNFQIGAFSLYKGCANESELLELMDNNAERYDETYDLYVEQNGAKVSYDSLLELDEQYPVYAKVKLSQTDKLTADTVYLYNKTTGENEKDAVISYNGSEYEIKFTKLAAEYELVIDKAVSTDGKLYRSSDYRLPITIKENDAFRAKIKSDILEAAKQALAENPDYEALKNRLSEYKDFLKIDYTSYNQCIGTDKIITRLAEYINSTPEFDFSDVKEKFEAFSAEQILLDFSDAVEELNGLLKNQKPDTAVVEEIVYNKYKQCFNVSDELTDRYNALSDKAGAWNKLSGKSYDKNNAKQSLESFLKDFNDAVIAEEKDEFFVALNTADKDSLEKLLQDMESKYEDLSPDLTDKDYTDNKDKILGLLADRSLAPDNFKKEFSRCSAAVCLNGVEAGNRQAIGAIISKYESALEIPSVYNNTTKTEIHKYMIGKSYTPDNIEEVIVSSAKEYEDDKNKDSGKGNSGNSGSSSSNNKSGGISAGYVPSEKGIEIIKKNEEALKPSFDDIDGVEWAKESILALAEKGIIKGKEKNAFMPNDNITREEFLKIVVMAFGLKGDTEIKFEDVKEDAWYTPYVKTAVANKIINGVTDTQFGVGMNITRQDMATILGRIIDDIGVQLETVHDTVSFADQDEIAEYAGNYMLVLAKKGVISGMGENKISPKENTTRAQAAKVIYFILSNNKNNAQ
ncbi:MAG: S-layer homology domain-containing protein [Clostridia bacterium]|nr:S-layer homology domain-containing protein [Clostridia bacterium]